jgi:uncharacterized protein
VGRWQIGGLAALTCVAAAIGAVAFRLLGLPLAWILGGLAGAAIVANTVGPMPGGRYVRRAGQLVVGISIGVVLDPEIISVLLDLFPAMLLIAVAANLVGALAALPIAGLAGVDRVTSLLSCLPAGMAEMATLAREVSADEQSVTIVHTLRVMIVITLIPLWLSLTGHPARPPSLSHGVVVGDLTILLPVLVVSLAIALLATRLRVINAFVITPMLLCLGIVAFGHHVPAVPSVALAAAQVAIGASLGLRFRLDRMRQIPRVALAGVVSGLALFAVAFYLFAPLVERVVGLDHLSSVLATAPGGLGEMIASASALGVLAAPVAGFQLARSILTNLITAPIIRSLIHRRRARATK